MGRDAVFFDLDGTLTDPKPGLTECIRYALTKLGRVAPAADELLWCIGPPLPKSFATLLASDEPTLIARSMALYRERYGTIGLFENALYPGIPEAVAAVRAGGVATYVMTSKPHVYATRIVDRMVDDATRVEWSLTGVDKRFDWASVKSQIDDLGGLSQIGDAWRWGRLYGGGLVVLAVDDGQEHHLFRPRVDRGLEDGQGGLGQRAGVDAQVLLEPGEPQVMAVLLHDDPGHVPLRPRRGGELDARIEVIGPVQLAHGVDRQDVLDELLVLDRHGPELLGPSHHPVERLHVVIPRRERLFTDS